MKWLFKDGKLYDDIKPLKVETPINERYLFDVGRGLIRPEDQIADAGIVVLPDNPMKEGEANEND